MEPKDYKKSELIFKKRLRDKKCIYKYRPLGQHAYSNIRKIVELNNKN